ncbi:MAG: ribosome-binding factor A [Patescibacteria group bacterium]
MAAPSSFDRHDRAASLLKEVVAKFIQLEANTNPMITVTHVTVSPDYRKVTVYVTTIPDGREADALIFLKRSASEMRGYVKKRTNLKIIPHLEFAYDYGEKHRQHIDEIARDIDETSHKTSEEVVDELLDSGKEPKKEITDNM